MDVVLQDQQARSQSCEPAAERGGQREDAPRVDAHQRHDGAVLADGADCRPEVSPAKKEPQSDDAAERGAKCHEPRGGE